MTKTKFARVLSALLCLLMIACVAVFAISCDNSEKEESKAEPPADGSKPAEESKPAEDGKKVVGEGKTVFNFKVVAKDKSVTLFEVHTDKKTVGEALLELKLIAGDDSEYGLYVKTVNGETLDFEKDKLYWAFYVNGKYADKGVDKTEITEGTTYSFEAAE